jgi:hypothetical protein
MDWPYATETEPASAMAKTSIDLMILPLKLNRMTL